MKRMLLCTAIALVLSSCAGSGRRDQPSPLTMASGAPRTAEQMQTRIDAVVLKLRIDPKRREIAGDATLTLRTDAPLSTLVLDLDRRYAIDAVELAGTVLAAAQWRNPDGRLRIDLTQPSATDVPFDLRIR